MIGTQLRCRKERRRADVRAASLFGLDYVDTSDDQKTLFVHFLGKAPAELQLGNIRVDGGRRILDVRVLALRLQRQTDPTRDDFMEVTLNKSGDFSTYTLSVVGLDEQGLPTQRPFAGFDPRYNAVPVLFKAGCPSDLDCKSEPACPPPERTLPEINYLAKDYDGFRRLILDRLAVTLPAWQEGHVPDLGVALVELLAYVADYLSYYQDAVATEAYLGTARKRISVRRHARLVDYAMHEGCNARAWLSLYTEQEQSFDPAEIYFITPFPGLSDAQVLTERELANVPSSRYEIFEPLWPHHTPISIYPAHSELHFYTWGDCECCLAPGATSATLVDRWIPIENAPPIGVPPSDPKQRLDVIPDSRDANPPGTGRQLRLKAGDVLIFEEVLGAKTGNPADADPTHRQAVRLTRVTPGVDPLYHPNDPKFGQPIVEVEWAPEDALTFALCITASGLPPTCECLENVSVARGNVILVDHGGRTTETLGTVATRSVVERCATECQPADSAVLPCLFRPLLGKQQLTFSQPLPECGSARAMLLQDPRQALPALELSSIPPAPGCRPAPAPAPPCEIPSLFDFADLTEPTSLAKELKAPVQPGAQFLLPKLSSATRSLLAAYDGTGPVQSNLRAGLIADLTALLGHWSPARDLIERSPSDAVFVAEVDDEGYAHLRFGDGRLGRMPDAGSSFEAAFRSGNGTKGNVGAETISRVVLRNETLSGVMLKSRNPLAASGGTEPELTENVKRFAPDAFRSTLERAITADDYATLAADNQRRLQERSRLLLALMLNGTALSEEVCRAPFVSLQGAKAALRWTGSWYQALVALDPLGSEDASDGLLEEVAAYLEPRRRIGHDLQIARADYVSLDLAITVCVLPQYLRGHLESALLRVLGNRVWPDGTRGFFHPDNLRFGEGIFVSRIVAAAQSVTGVQNVHVTRLQRYDVGSSPGNTELPAGSVFSLGPLQIARLDNDPSFPENERLVLDLRGGR